MEQVSKKNSRLIIASLVQSVASGLFIAQLADLNLLSHSMVWLLAIGLVFCLVIILGFTKLGDRWAVLGMVLSLIITTSLMGLSPIIRMGKKTVEKIGVEETVVEHYFWVEKKESANGNDWAGKKIGIQTALKGEMSRWIDYQMVLTKRHQVTLIKYPHLEALGNALEDGEVDGIVLKKEWIIAMKDLFEGFETDNTIVNIQRIEETIQDSDKKILANPFVTYISGIDTFGELSVLSRSDVNILCVVNPISHQIYLVTTPRDYYVPFPGLSGKEQRDKLTHAGKYGVEISSNALSNLYDVPIEYYARVNFTSMTELVDLLGGVTVYSKEPFTINVKGKKVDIIEGMNDLNGDEALRFSRERYSLVAGDYQRGKNQQEVIRAMMEKLLKPGALMNMGKMMDVIAKNVDTNYSNEELKAIIKYQIEENPNWTFKTAAAEGEEDYAICPAYPEYGELFVSVPVEESVDIIKKEIQMVLKGEPLEGEKFLIPPKVMEEDLNN